MKNIELTPEWFKKNRSRKLNYRSQLTALVLLFAFIIVFDFILNYGLSKAGEGLDKLKSQLQTQQSTTVEFARINSEIEKLTKKEQILEHLDSGLNVSNVLGELSFLVDNTVVLEKIEFKTESFGLQKNGNSRPIRGIRAAGTAKKGESALPDKVKFKLVIRGLAADGQSVATLVCRLEDSPYFFLVHPSFSQNKLLNVEKSEKYQVSEFELNCYLANYREENKIFAQNINN